MLAGALDYTIGEMIRGLAAYLREDESFAYLAQFYVDTHNHIADTLESGKRSKEELASALTNFYSAEAANVGYRHIIESLASECGSLDGFVRQLIKDLESAGDIKPTDGKYEWTGERIIF
jgi:hypothetical protein